MFQKGILFVICGFLASPVIGEAEYYTWVDENGVTNYAERNPRGRRVENHDVDDRGTTVRLDRR